MYAREGIVVVIHGCYVALATIYIYMKVGDLGFFCSDEFLCHLYDGILQSVV